MRKREKTKVDARFTKGLKGGSSLYGGVVIHAKLFLGAFILHLRWISHGEIVRREDQAVPIPGEPGQDLGTDANKDNRCRRATGRRWPCYRSKMIPNGNSNTKGAEPCDNHSQLSPPELPSVEQSRQSQHRHCSRETTSYSDSHARNILRTDIWCRCRGRRGARYGRRQIGHTRDATEVSRIIRGRFLVRSVALSSKTASNATQERR